jgi:hypothetical protein
LNPISLRQRRTCSASCHPSLRKKCARNQHETRDGSPSGCGKGRSLSPMLTAIRTGGRGVADPRVLPSRPRCGRYLFAIPSSVARPTVRARAVERAKDVRRSSGPNSATSTGMWAEIQAAQEQKNAALAARVATFRTRLAVAPRYARMEPRIGSSPRTNRSRCWRRGARSSTHEGLWEGAPMTDPTGRC